MVDLLSGCVPYKEEDVKKYNELKWWEGLTFGDLLDRAADVHPDKEAFVDRVTRLTYGEAREKVNQLAIGMMDLGIQPKDRVMVQLPNWNEFVFAYFALQKIGAITVLLIDRYRQYEINHLTNITGATYWVVPVKHKKTDYTPIMDDVLKENPGIKKVITVRGERAGEKFESLEGLMAKADMTQENLDRLVQRRPDPMQIAHMGPTGGTTGAPKVVPRSHNSLVTGITYCSRSWEQSNLDINLIAGPIGHDLSFSKGFMGSIITMGKVVLLDSPDNKSICETIQQEKITSIIWVPTLAQRLLQYEDINQYDLTSLQKMHSAGGASHPGMVKDVIDKLNCKFFNGYGGTEGPTTITRINNDLETICGTVGRPTCPYDTYKVIDPFGKEVETDKQGELVLKGPGVFTGYYENPEENKTALNEDGFFKTGDLARIDENGYITLTGRIKEMINRGGESISSTEIEKLITLHPEVAMVAVIPMPDEDMGEKACAYIQPTEGSQLDFDNVIAFLKAQDASVLQLPERIEFIDEMPYTGAQKLDKRTLREDIENKLKTEAQMA
ncbi:2,3-dihydroxybenzoate-AMP ligase [Desulfosarcina ovata subsp. sediminis]|uniref:2,3-dihydroxybenzoate-AMP ligase n=1 Tax=Desulfosarcina ovata subsp. sediminis TaxID=885957 RepID=A0A5K7ZVR5_9BACT|nr:class I adenylate-forming enzyme family protein [Desulfosarcina ovata]BBO84345.1 2,3-dihydroxybenzoate-AMP ligase [Desulfosarcina ovata subsp. sediminis]